jgi:hypothetical protein
MASRVDPGNETIDRGGEDTDRANNPAEPADPQVLAGAADESVHQGRGFPSGGGDAGSDRTGTAAGTPGGPGAGGTTGRGATDARQADRDNTPGGTARADGG